MRMSVDFCLCDAFANYLEHVFLEFRLLPNDLGHVQKILVMTSW